MEYQQLDNTTRLNMVRSRIRDLENQYFNLEIRINSPDLQQPPNEMDQQNLDRLQKGLDYLHQLESQLSGSGNQAGSTATG